MYCRKCGSYINNHLDYCPKCGLKQIKIEKKKTVNIVNHHLKIPSLIPAIIFTSVAFILAIFPWPKSLHIGTSFAMRVTIFIIALLSDYHCIKSKQMNNFYIKKYQAVVHPKLIFTLTFISNLTTIVALFSLVTL